MQGSRQKRKPARSSRRKPVSEVDAHLGYWLRFVSTHVSHAFQMTMEAHGVTVSEWVLLREIYATGPTSATALAARTGMSKGAVSKLLARIEAKALLERETLDADRRHHALALSAAGQALVPELAQLADQNDEAFFGHLPAQVRTALVDVMKNVVAVHGLKNVAAE
ncbi:MarR family winged helix-turn-helix transcriptional regulator [Paraburkholderia antibiotica]|uniref:Winged helix-turn-helix transcriptional regulator n=1 Tax=Paraburkholderia antibiotica TaxID=2728839 RepID=A0A7X9X4T5_9BURK|nr:MarR family winged helix-turn-helix transcriptional regulator [Paraburkholderia antibiotica]NML31457.1 winged helix-turn-helix transcriptional regulator [Paraburkholderia antibiotica]